MRPKREVMIVDTGSVYPSVEECAEALGCDMSALYKVLRGERPHHLGYSFAYVDEYSKSVEFRPNDKWSRNRRVRIVETGDIFDNIRACAAALKVRDRVVFDVVRGVVANIDGYHITWYGRE